MDMEEIERVADTEKTSLPAMKVEPRYDAQMAGRRQVRVIKVGYDKDPMKEQTVFEFAGFVYICYAKKTRGRSMIRCLGLADVERPKVQVKPADVQAILENDKQELQDDGQSRGPDQTPDA